MIVTFLDASDTYDLRRLVLRAGQPDAVVAFAEDDHEGAFHLGARLESGDLVGVASFSPQPCPRRPGRAALQLRGMAVLDELQRSGVGRALLRAGIEEARARRFPVLWANARDSAIGFYGALGMAVEGEGFVTATGIPHHMVVVELA